jgi:hypothetical protein
MDMVVERQYVFSRTFVHGHAVQCSACTHQLLAVALTWRLLGPESWK